MKRTKDKQEPEREQVGVHIDVKLWRKFRARALEEGKQAGQLVEELIGEYLGKKDKNNKAKAGFPLQI